MRTRQPVLGKGEPWAGTRAWRASSALRVFSLLVPLWDGISPLWRSTPEFLSSRARLEPLERQLLLLEPILCCCLARGPGGLPEVQRDGAAIPDLASGDGTF